MDETEAPAIQAALERLVESTERLAAAAEKLAQSLEILAAVRSGGGFPY